MKFSKWSRAFQQFHGLSSHVTNTHGHNWKLQKKKNQSDIHLHFENGSPSRLLVPVFSFAPENPEDGKMYLLVLAHAGCPGQSPQSRKMVVCV